MAPHSGKDCPASSESAAATVLTLKGTSGDPVFGVSSCSRLLLVIFQRFQRFPLLLHVAKQRFDQHLAPSPRRLVASTPSASPIRHPTLSPPLPLSFLLVLFLRINSLPPQPPAVACFHHGSSVSPCLLTCLSAVGITTFRPWSIEMQSPISKLQPRCITATFGL